jgi:hypothetical protein
MRERHKSPVPSRFASPGGWREVVGSVEVAHDATIDLDAGKTPEWAGATLYKKGRSSPVVVVAVSYAASVFNDSDYDRRTEKGGLR